MELSSVAIKECKKAMKKMGMSPLFSRMKLSSVEINECKKAMKKMGMSILGRGCSSKCKTKAKMAAERIKLLRNRGRLVVREMRRDIAMLIESGHEATARIRVEHLIREQNVMVANKLLEIFCNLIVVSHTIIAEQRECPADLKEGISSLIFASLRCSNIPELIGIRDIFAEKYGKDFVSAAINLRPNCGVNHVLIEKLSFGTPSGEVKLQVLKEIVKEYQVDWDITESEMELLKSPEALIDGPSTFTTTSTFPVNSTPNKHFEQPKKLPSRCVGGGNSGRDMAHFRDSAAAAEVEKRAIVAIEVATHLSRKETKTYGLNNTRQDEGMNRNHINDGKIFGTYVPNNLTPSSGNPHDKLEMDQPMKRINTFGNVPPPSDVMSSATNSMDVQKMYKMPNYNKFHSSRIEFDESEYDEEIEAEKPPTSSNGLPTDRSTDPDSRNLHMQHNNNVSSANPEVKYDELDYHEDDGDMEEYIGVKQLPNRHAEFPTPPYWKQNSSPNVHPKLPDYHEDDGDMEEYIGVKHSPNRHAEFPTPTYWKQNSSPNVHPKLPDYDEEDGDMEEYIGVKQSPNRHAEFPTTPYSKQNSSPYVHPKLPDYDELVEHFSALKKYHTSERYMF